MAASSAGVVRLRRATGPEEWAAQLERPGATPFHSWHWLHTIAPLMGGRLHPLVAVRAGEVVGLAPVILSKDGAVLKANVVPFQYLGPLAEVDDLPAIAAALRRWAVRRGALEVQVMFHPDAGVPEGALAEAGFEERRDTTYLVPLVDRSSEEVFASFGRDVRNAVRRSARNGVEVRPSTADEIRTVLPRLHEEALGYVLPVVPAFADWLAAADDGLPFSSLTAVLEGRPIGMAVQLHGDVTMGWLGGVFGADQRSGAYTALMWGAMQAALAAGDPVFDMLAAPDEGIARYKRGFRPLAAAYGEWSWVYPPYRLVRRGRSAVLARRARQGA